MKKLYFKAKTYGYGWYPASWEGWLIIFVYLVCIAGVILRARYLQIADAEALQQIAFPVAVLTAILIWISCKTGEKPRWRWGKDT